VFLFLLYIILSREMGTGIKDGMGVGIRDSYVCFSVLFSVC